MDVTSSIILSLIVSAFVTFAGVLAYGDYATQQARRSRANEAANPEPLKRPAAVEHRDAA
jgi:hypothetical protein